MARARRDGLDVPGPKAMPGGVELSLDHGGVRHHAPVRLRDHVDPSDGVAPIPVGEPLGVVAPGLVEQLA
jgi:hypothetical protein